MIDRIVGKKVIGIKQTKKFMNNGLGKVLYVAKDADNNLIMPLIELASQNKIIVVEIQSMKDLGKMCSIDVNAAATLLLE